MTKPHLPEEPQFIKKISSLQRILSGVAISTFITVWVSGFDFVVNIFKPDFVIVLTYLRIGMASVGMMITCIVGGQQLQYMIGWITENYEIYRKITAYKKEQDKDK